MNPAVGVEAKGKEGGSRKPMQGSAKKATTLAVEDLGDLEDPKWCKREQNASDAREMPREKCEALTTDRGRVGVRGRG